MRVPGINEEIIAKVETPVEIVEPVASTGVVWKVCNFRYFSISPATIEKME